MLKNTGITLALATLAVVGALGIDAYLPSLHAITESLQASPVAVQQTLSIYIATMAITTLFAGTLSDSFGRRPTVMGALLLFTGASVLALFANDIETLLLARGLQGIAAGFSAVLSRTIVQDRFQGPEAQRVMALITMLFSIAPSIAPIVGGWLQSNFGWHSVFVLLGVYGFGLWALWAVGVPETLPQENRVPFRFGSILGNYVQALTHLPFVMRILGIALAFIGISIYVSSSAHFVMDVLGLSETSFGWVFVPLTAGMLLGSSIARRSARKVAPGKLISIGFVLMIGSTAINVLYTSLTDHPEVPWATLPLGFYNLGMAMAIPGMTVEVLSIFPQMRGLAASLQSFVQMTIFALIAALVAPLIYHSAYLLAVTHLVGLLIGLACWAIGCKLSPARPAGQGGMPPGPGGKPAG